MGQTYAGILGVVAFVAVLGRGLVQGAQPASMLTNACLALLLFAIVGFFVGQIGALAIRDSVRIRFRDKLNSAKEEVAAEESAPAN